MHMGRPVTCFGPAECNRSDRSQFSGFAPCVFYIPRYKPRKQPLLGLVAEGERAMAKPQRLFTLLLRWEGITSAHTALASGCHMTKLHTNEWEDIPPIRRHSRSHSNGQGWITLLQEKANHGFSNIIYHSHLGQVVSLLCLHLRNTGVYFRTQ